MIQLTLSGVLDMDNEESVWQYGNNDLQLDASIIWSEPRAMPRFLSSSWLVRG